MCELYHTKTNSMVLLPSIAISLALLWSTQSFLASWRRQWFQQLEYAPGQQFHAFDAPPPFQFPAAEIIETLEHWRLRLSVVFPKPGLSRRALTPFLKKWMVADGQIRHMSARQFFKIYALINYTLTWTQQMAWFPHPGPKQKFPE